MKARIKNSGFEVDVIPRYDNGVFIGFADSDTNMVFYRAVDLDFSNKDNTDWSAFRREAAKDILCALLQGNESYDSLYEVHHAIEMTDELIRQLKDGEK